MATIPSNQVSIVHLSDIHFDIPPDGVDSQHCFDPEAPSSGDPASRVGYPTLLDTLRADWKTLGQSIGTIIVAVTGDLTQRADPKEFTIAQELLGGLTQEPILNSRVSKSEIYVVPGNHDVIYDESNPEGRWQPYVSFYQNFYRELPRRKIYTDDPRSLSRVHDRTKDLGLVVVELNSCIYVEKGKSGEDRGEIDTKAIESVEKQLQKIPKKNLKQSIRVALVHHHPILIPAFAEPKKEYDAILHANWLLMVLRDYGFHVVLHGHKHYPHTFLYDTTCSWTTDNNNSIMIVAGGSAGSRILPRQKNAVNTYNLLTIKWNWEANEARIHVETRGLKTSDSRGRNLLPGRWKWVTLRVIDQILKPPHPSLTIRVHHEPFDPGDFGEQKSFETERTKVYEQTRGNMPVVELIPSLQPGQEYEAYVRIVPHNRRDEDIPVEVVWSAGPKFQLMSRCRYDENPDFRGSFSYYGPMLIQARMQFSKGPPAVGHVYAHLPGT